MALIHTLFSLMEQFYDRHVESLFHKSRFRRRIGPYGLSPNASPPVATLDLCHRLTCKAPICDRFSLSYGGFYARLRQPAPTNALLAGSGMLLTAIDLKKYGDYPTYLKALRKRSGNFCRDALKANRLGYRIESFDRSMRVNDIRAIHRSRKVRSFGLVFEAIFPFHKENVTTSHSAADGSQSPCGLHWDLAFGIFANPENGSAPDGARSSRLVGYASLHRIGNVVTYADLIGHGDHLHDGIMMLLHTVIMEWLLDSENMYAKGLDYLANGTLERGNEGMFFWKKKALFAPYLVNLLEEPLPADFNATEYLKLNRDVALAGEDAVSHYRKHGRKEQRPYKTSGHSSDGMP